MKSGCSHIHACYTKLEKLFIDVFAYYLARAKYSHTFSIYLAKKQIPQLPMNWLRLFYKLLIKTELQLSLFH